jgi:hypothetical protein
MGKTASWLRWFQGERRAIYRSQRTRNCRGQVIVVEQSVVRIWVRRPWAFGSSKTGEANQYYSKSPVEDIAVHREIWKKNNHRSRLQDECEHNLDMKLGCRDAV